jgi:hypothetical protein
MTSPIAISWFQVVITPLVLYFHGISKPCTMLMSHGLRFLTVPMFTV